MSTANNSGNNGNWISIPITGQWITGSIITITGAGGGGGGGVLPPPPEEIVNVEYKDGCSCKKCKEFYEFAEPNQEDGTLVCWSCRHGY